MCEAKIQPKLLDEVDKGRKKGICDEFSVVKSTFSVVKSTLSTINILFYVILIL